MFEEQREETDCGPIPTLLAIWDVAHEVKLPAKRAEWVIEQYAATNLAHDSITELLRLGRWSKLADLLYNDAKDLPVTIPPQMEDDIGKLSALIACIRDEFFLIEKGDDDFPPAWRANDGAAEYRNQLRGKTGGKERTKADLVEKAVKRGNQAAKKRGKQAVLVEKAIRSKRETGQEFSLGEVALAKTTGNMEKMVGIQTQIELKEEGLGRLYHERDKAIEALVCNWDIGDIGWLMSDGIKVPGYDTYCILVSFDRIQFLRRQAIDRDENAAEN